MISRIALTLLSLSVFATSVHGKGDERRRTLVVPIDLSGYFFARDQYRREVTLALEERLRAAQFAVLREPLTAAEAECREVACLARIADAHNAAIVVAGRLMSTQQVKVSYRGFVRIVERAAGKTTEARERQVECDNCTESEVRDKMATLMTAAIANEPEPKPSEHKIGVQPPAPDPLLAPPGLPQPHVPAPPRFKDRLTRGERWLLRGSGIAALAVGVGLLVQGFVEVGHDGDLVVEDGQTFRRNTAAYGQPLFFTLGAASVIAGIVLNVVGWRPWPVRVSPSVSSTGAHLQIEGRF
jgi:hypothetical protein